MNTFTGIIAMSLLVCSLAAPARAELSETAAAGEETSGQTLSAPGKGSGEAGINSLLDRFAGIVSADPSTEKAHDSSLAIVSSISENTLFSDFIRTGSPMNAYYSRSGSDNKDKITEISRSADFVATAPGGDRFVLPDAGLAALVGGHFVGSGVVVGDADVTQIQAASSDPEMIQTNSNIATESPVPLPLPFLLTGSGLAALLGLRKRAWNVG